jgi:hypothetical protein
VRTEYDRKTKRAYIELRTCDADGGDAIVQAWKAAYYKAKELGWL